uniref:Putative L-ribulose-5-phosphate 3-epimerase sgbU n=1 Tax=Lygus hesperus TaxID=30085 RepID=A0A0A9YKV1_LYGHE
MLRTRRQKLLTDYEMFISTQVDQTNELARRIQIIAPHETTLLSLLQVLAAGVGSVAYQRIMEASFMPLLAFDAKRHARNEDTEEATSERQNRIMQQALLPYCEKLLLLHRTAIG